jgi:hypothetical protein
MSHLQIAPSNEDGTLIIESGEDGSDDEDIYHDHNPNHLPSDMYTRRPFSLATLALMGFYAVDGINQSDGTRTGFGLRTTEFPYLKKLLRRSGVSSPKLK